MGVNGLAQFLKKHAREAFVHKQMSDYRNEKIVYDGLNTLYKFCIAVRNKGSDLTDVNKVITTHLYAIQAVTSACMNHKITPIFVFDGKPPSIKSKTLQNRALKTETAEANLKTATTNENKIKLFKKSFKIQPSMIHECKKLLEFIGLRYVQAPEEADSQCASITKSTHNDIQYIASDDLDNLAFGAPYVLRNFSKKGVIEEVSLKTILEKLNISHTHFVDLCILATTDYCGSIRGIGASSAYGLIKEVIAMNTYDVLNINSIPHIENLIEFIKQEKNRKQIWNNDKDVIGNNLTNDQVNYYVNKLINDSRFNIMFRILVKLTLEKNKNDKSKYVIPENFTEDYIKTKLYYTETAVVEDPREISNNWNNTYWLQPNTQHLYKYMVEEKNFKHATITMYLKLLSQQYDSTIHNKRKGRQKYYRDYSTYISYINQSVLVSV